MFKSAEEKLLIAVKKNDVAAVASLLGRKLNIEHPEMPDRMTALHWAAFNGQTQILKMLLARGADRDSQNRFAATPLLMAASANHTQEILLLIEAGANVSLPQYTYTYPLHLAAEKGNYEAARALLAAGAQADVETSKGHTPLQLALEKGHAKLAQLLVQHGARIKPADKRALGRARLMGIEQLVQAGAAPAAVACDAAPAAQVSSGWHKLDDAKIALIEEFPQLSRKITTLFNFAARERLVITQNLQTQQESLATPESFDAVAPELVEKAYDEFTRQGGVADRGAVLGGQKLNIKR